MLVELKESTTLWAVIDVPGSMSVSHVAQRNKGEPPDVRT